MKTVCAKDMRDLRLSKEKQQDLLIVELISIASFPQCIYFLSRNTLNVITVNCIVHTMRTTLWREH